MKCFQEVPVAALVPGYRHNSHKVDWFIDELGIVIEVHGKQHYELQNFGNSPYMDALKNFNNIKYRDNLKKTALIDAGYEYKEIHYKIAKKINAQTLKEIIFGDQDE